MLRGFCYLCCGLLVSLLVGCNAREEKLTVCFTGDLLLDRGVREQIEKRGIEELFKQVKPLFQTADFTVANLECPVTNWVAPLNKKYIFRAEPRWLEAVREAGITHLNLANNHTNDQGRTGMRDTYKSIKHHHLEATGHGENQRQACEPTIIRKSGIRVAIFASVLVPLENWPYLPDSVGACQATVRDLIVRIMEYKQQFPQDRIVVTLHWGAEFQEMPTLTQRQEAKALVEAGADAIIGHHPHVVQKPAYYQEKPVFYSLGNFVFDQKQPAAQRGLVVQLTFTKEKTTAKEIPIVIRNCAPQPVE